MNNQQQKCKKNFAGIGKSSIFAASNDGKKSQEESEIERLTNADVTQLVE